MAGLTISSDGFIFRDNMPIFRVLDQKWGAPIFDKISSVYTEHGEDVAVALLATYQDLLPGKIRKMNDFDMLELHRLHKQSVYGNKHQCRSCGKKFYDLMRHRKCPFCLTEVSFSEDSI